MAQVALRRAVSLNPSSPGGLGASWVISWMTAGKRGRGSRSDSDEGQYPAKKVEFWYDNNLWLLISYTTAYITKSY